MVQSPSAHETTGVRHEKIGLALSGGGFRASIFHLGVIRRLEELGIMKDVSVLSTVSGGSIIGAYYACEMEKRLRARRGELEKDPSAEDAIRLELFEDIAEAFFGALRHNMRTRALVFTPFFHPILFLKSLGPTVSRSDIIQQEYDIHLFEGSWLYEGETLAQLPNVTRDEDGPPGYLVGPELVINATSLLTGERVSLSRRAISGIKELKKANTNVLPVARAVGASACVPGLFPPTPIAGDMLVDGGVSDNQGVDGLLKEGKADEENFDLIMVSDASGQLEQLDRQSPKAASVMPRLMSIFQHEIRNKGLTVLKDWKEKANLTLGVKENEEPKASFAFVHLFLDLKSRVDAAQRIPSEYIPALGRIRTDLDQFSMIEREALMYHGYTLIDAQLQKYCTHFLKARKLEGKNIPSMRRPPLFAERTSTATSEFETEPGSPDTRRVRHQIKRELIAGAKPLFILRSIIKYPWTAGPLVAATWIVPIVLFFLIVHKTLRDTLWVGVASWLKDKLTQLVPGWGQRILLWVLGSELTGSVVEAVTVLLAALLEVLALAYLLSLLTYMLVRKVVPVWDKERYQGIAGTDYSVKWK